MAEQFPAEHARYQKRNKTAKLVKHPKQQSLYHHDDLLVFHSTIDGALTQLVLTLLHEQKVHLSHCPKLASNPGAR